MHLDCHESDYPHVIALFRRGGAWGALSKTNGAPLRYRDPIYRTLRELTLSYFHEYSNKRGHKTLRSYSRPFDLRRIPVDEWVICEKSCWKTHDRLTDLPHYDLITSRQARLLAKRDAFDANHLDVGHADEAQHGAQIRLLEVVCLHRPLEVNSAAGKHQDRLLSACEPGGAFF